MDPWAAFWNTSGTSANTASLAELSPPTRTRLDAPWRALARELPKRSKVLDLATGGGIVLDLLRKARPDLQLTGVDAAKRLPRPVGMILMAGVLNENLPFAAARFDAVTSRFGIEYGDLDAASREAARVMRRGARLRLILHHADGLVLLHNLARLEALRWAAIDSGWFQRGLIAVRGRVLGGLPQPASSRAAPADAMARFPGQPVAAEFLTGLNQVLDWGAGRSSEQVLAALENLRERADGEIARLEALAGAACNVERIERLRAAFSQAGVESGPAEVLTDGHGSTLAWHLTGTRL